jgi:hypothetical protein
VIGVDVLLIDWEDEWEWKVNLCNEYPVRLVV